MDWTPLTANRDSWQQAGERLRSGELSLVSLWGEPRLAHMAVMDRAGALQVLHLACGASRFPSIGRLHPPAIRLERAMRDLADLDAEGAPDTRAWLRHGPSYPFLPAEGESLHQIPVGPVHAGIIEPGHFRFTANGETVVRLEERLGYAHKGIDSLLAGAPLERLANHFGDIGAVCNDAAFSIMHASCGVLREQVLRASNTCFGHRLMMDCVVPGGMRSDLAPAGKQHIAALIALVRQRFPELVELYDNTASLKDRTVDTGILSPALAQQFAAGGYVGRASGRNFDARRTPGYPPYGDLQFEVPVVQAGDVNARVWIRIQEVEQSLALVEQILARLPAGPVSTALAAAQAAEGVALVEGFRGDIFAWIRVGADGRVERCHLRDPSWFQWPLLEAAIEGNIVADFPLCNK